MSAIMRVACNYWHNSLSRVGDAKNTTEYWDRHDHSGPVHTYPDIFENEDFFRRFQKKKIVSTRSGFESFSPVHTKPPKRMEIASLTERAQCYWNSLKFFLHSSGTTIWFTKLSHHALVRPGLTQNLRGVAGLLFNRFTAPVLDTGAESNLIIFSCFLT